MANRHLTCIDCGVVSDGDARGWIGRRYDDPETDRPPELVFYCSSCTVREFGGDMSAGRHVQRDEPATGELASPSPGRRRSPVLGALLRWRGRNAASRRTALAG